MFSGFYQGRRVLVTGHTGFKGGWLSLWLKRLGASVWGVSLPPPTHPNLHEIIQAAAFAGEIQCDIRNLDGLAAAVNKIQPEVIFHLAAQPIVRRSYAEPLETFHTNAVGTANLLESVRKAESNSILIVITSDKCYENREWEFAYRENDSLGGHDVYSMSKAATELVAQSWVVVKGRPLQVRRNFIGRVDRLLIHQQFLDTRRAHAQRMSTERADF